ncbi:hypothetical protein CRP01_28900 [Flavilitoribacter nigricans DSM 23189 = NBRC 102662]|uniref:Uncharacterized protein n=1 Tax=Flavilitoribacter nigricans (strain ATCC 23147 / DSM 23189 / NBRC 102662 / NCIMB 1420 / SS-2) TaxID=1122177 RepID=A0A2D0N3Y0_FLAN2|nr:hypothetical protein CRP01_28900 [Flavilitoribacter nigricans DSM 23189 = NBRC 102662]
MPAHPLPAIPDFLPFKIMPHGAAPILIFLAFVEKSSVIVWLRFIFNLLKVKEVFKKYLF